MSLDVYLYVGEERIEECTHCDGTGKINHGKEKVHEDNITHNLNKMADAAGIYAHLWRPEELGFTKAGQLINPLKAGLERLRADPEKYNKFNPANGWGDYEGLVRFVQNYLNACEDHPEAEIYASR